MSLIKPIITYIYIYITWLEFHLIWFLLFTLLGFLFYVRPILFLKGKEVFGMRFDPKSLSLFHIFFLNFACSQRVRVRDLSSKEGKGGVWNEV
jgi:hypothetical protein